MTFSEDNNGNREENNLTTLTETVRNFFMMENSTQEQKANFMVGGDLDETEEKDEFPPRVMTKQLTEIAINDKRRRLRYVVNEFLIEYVNRQKKCF